MLDLKRIETLLATERQCLLRKTKKESPRFSMASAAKSLGFINNQQKRPEGCRQAV